MTDHPLLLERCAHWCSAAFRKNRVPFLSSVFIGLLCYMYAFTNKLVNHDEVQSLFLKGGTVTSGRWGLGALDTIFPNYSMPWIYGIITIILISTAICLILRILSIRNPGLQVLLAGCIMAFPSLIGTFAYMFTSSSFGLSFLMAVLAVRLLEKKGLAYTAAALCCMVFSLSIYQSYISVAAGLLVVLMIRRTLQKEELGTLLREGAGYVLFLAVSLGVYYITTQVIFILKDVTFNSYAEENMGFSLANIPAAIVQAYISFLRFFTEGYLGLIPSAFSRTLHLIGLACGLLLLLLRFREIRSSGHILLALALIAVLPLAINCMYLFTTAGSIHTLVLYGFVCLYALMAVLTEEVLLPAADSGRLHSLRSLSANLLTLALALIIVCNTYLANQIWLNLQLRYENAYSFYTTLMADIRTLPQFGPDSRLALIGDYRDPAYFDENFSFTKQITGTRGFMPDTYSKERFLEYYLGVSIPFATEQEVQALSSLPEVIQMPAYPYFGSVTAIGDTIVVKLS